MNNFMAKPTNTFFKNLVKIFVKEESTEITKDAETESDEPIFDIHTDIVDGQIRVKADWNTAFIDILKRHGYNGANEEVIVQQYLAVIHRNLIEEEHNNGDSFQ